jgi:hypothetical protein
MKLESMIAGLRFNKTSTVAPHQEHGSEERPKQITFMDCVRKNPLMPDPNCSYYRELPAYRKKGYCHGHW